MEGSERDLQEAERTGDIRRAGLLWFREFFSFLTEHFFIAYHCQRREVEDPATKISFNTQRRLRPLSLPAHSSVPKGFSGLHFYCNVPSFVGILFFLRLLGLQSRDHFSIYAPSPDRVSSRVRRTKDCTLT